MAQDEPVDYRFSLANERTYLAWIRTAVALVAGGIVAAKALDFDHEVVRWILAVPPIAAGALLAGTAVGRWQAYEDAIRAGRALPSRRGMTLLALGFALYAVVALAALVLDG